MLKIRKARPADVDALAEASREAFHSDIHCGASEIGGPPGYDSAEWQKRCMHWGDYYTLQWDRQIIGGMIVLPKEPGHYELGRIFIHPDWQNRGIGGEAFQYLWRTYPLAQRWTLDTPKWNVRTRHFYAKMGFSEVGETDEDGILFERRIARGCSLCWSCKGDGRSEAQASPDLRKEGDTGVAPTRENSNKHDETSNRTL